MRDIACLVGAAVALLSGSLALMVELWAPAHAEVPTGLLLIGAGLVVSSVAWIYIIVERASWGNGHCDREVRG